MPRELVYPRRVKCVLRSQSTQRLHVLTYWDYFQKQIRRLHQNLLNSPAKYPQNKDVTGDCNYADNR